MSIPLRSFRLAGEAIKTALRLDSVVLPDNRGDGLSGHTLTFPVNPEAEYIDGSIYIDGAHHPVDVREICFGKTRDGLVDATLSAEIDFPFEGLHDFAKTPWQFTARLKWTDEAQMS